jgi:hypothetical protein
MLAVGMAKALAFGGTGVAIAETSALRDRLETGLQESCDPVVVNGSRNIAAEHAEHASGSTAKLCSELDLRELPAAWECVRAISRARRC